MKNNTGLIVIITFALMVAGVTFAADTGNVQVTVTAKSVSVTATDGSVAFGSVDLGASTSTVGSDQTQTVENAGNITEDINIRCSDATGGAVDWVLSTVTGTNIFAMDFSTTTGSGWLQASSTYLTLIESLGASATDTLDFRLHMPSTSDESTQKTIVVTVQAVQA
ncbi:MAG TPA: hypothetical protein PLV72_03390 [Candidatus Magasanikbacteria bacterium]|nr:hypothetical protein [Candidatus Magasanikbacteria bacterium]